MARNVQYVNNKDFKKGFRKKTLLRLLYKFIDLIYLNVASAP
jgi:hypothetical protein